MDTIRLGGARYLGCRADIRACRYVREDVYNVRQEQCTLHLLAEIQSLESTTFVCCQYAKRQGGHRGVLWPSGSRGILQSLFIRLSHSLSHTRFAAPTICTLISRERALPLHLEWFNTPKCH